MSMPRRTVRFLALTAWDVLPPDVVAVPLAVARNFYRCFLAVDPREKLELLDEARSLSDAEVAQVIDALAAGWAGAAVRELVLALHARPSRRSRPPWRHCGSACGTVATGRAGCGS